MELPELSEKVLNQLSDDICKKVVVLLVDEFQNVLTTHKADAIELTMLIMWTLSKISVIQLQHIHAVCLQSEAEGESEVTLEKWSFVLIDLIQSHVKGIIEKKSNKN